MVNGVKQMSGIDDVTPHIELEGAEDTAEAFRQIAEAAKTAFAQIEQAAAQVGGAGQHVAKAAEEGKKALSEMGVVGAEAFSKIMGAAMSGNFTGIVTMMFGHLAGAINEAGEKMVEFIHTQAELIETLHGLATATGMSLPQILAMREAFASVGISTNAFERSVGRLAITISNEWTHIQQAVRTSADQQVGAMLHVQQASLNLEKAHHAMNAALTESSSQAVHNSFGIEQSAIGLKKAGEALQDFLLQSRSNTLGIESAELALTRARMNLAKDQGHAVSPQDERALRIATDQLQVRQAELALQEAQNKKRKEATELEELNLRNRQAQQAAIDAQNKAIEDSIKMSDRLRDARLHEQQAALAVREAQEKQHEQDLRNIPAIAQQLSEVANRQRTWTEVINGTELSAQNLTKAIILAASAGSGAKPTTEQVWNEMARLFPQITDESMKLAIVQHTMGAGFRAGQASAAQLMAVLARGPEAMARLTKGSEEFLRTLSDPRLDRTTHMLLEFNAKAALLGSAFDTVKARLAGVMSVPVAEFFGAIRESLVSTEGTLNKLAVAFVKMVEGLASLASGVGALIAKIAGPAWNTLIEIISRVMTIFGQVAQSVGQVTTAITNMMGLKTDAFFSGFTGILIGAAVAVRGLWTAIGLLLARVAIIPLAIGLVVTAVGDLVKVWAFAQSKLPTWLGGGIDAANATQRVGMEIEKWGQAITREVLKLIPGLNDANIDAAGRRPGTAGDLTRGLTGNSEEIKRLMEGSAHTNQDAAHTQQQAAQTQHDAATVARDAANARLHERGPDGRSQNDRNQEFFDRRIREQAEERRSAAGAGRGADTAAPEQKEAADTQRQAATTQTQASGQFNTGVAMFDSVVNGMVSALAAVLTKIGAPGTGGEGRAGGGHIRGPGGPTDDRAGLFALSDGEYVMRSAAVSHYGPQLFEALNNLAFGGFATGGIVGARGASSPSGGASGASSILNLTIDGNHFNGLKAPEHVASKLKSYAVSRQSSSAQKMPSWMR